MFASFPSRAILAFGLTLLAAAGPVSATEADQGWPRPRLAVIDFRAVIADAKASRSIETQIRVPYQSEILDVENVLRDEERSLAQQRAELPQIEFDRRAREFQQRMMLTRRTLQRRKQQLDQAVAAARVEVHKKLVSVITEIAEENALDVVLLKSQVALVKNELDITGLALERLDAVLPDIAVDVPDPIRE